MTPGLCTTCATPGAGKTSIIAVSPSDPTASVDSVVDDEALLHPACGRAFVGGDVDLLAGRTLVGRAHGDLTETHLGEGVVHGYDRAVHGGAGIDMDGEADCDLRGVLDGEAEVVDVRRRAGEIACLQHEDDGEHEDGDDGTEEGEIGRASCR